MVTPCQGNKLSGGGHSILHRVSDVRRYAPADRVLEGLETEVRERGGKACGLIRSRYRRRSGKNEQVSDPTPLHLLRIFSLPRKKGCPYAYAAIVMAPENGMMRWARCGIERRMFLLGTHVQ